MKPSNQDEEGPRDLLVGVTVAEVAAVGIAMAMTWVPGRGGTTWSPADLLWDDPGTATRIAATFLVTNLIFASFAGIVWISTIRKRGGKS